MDDLGWRDLTCYGSSFYETPRLDKLAGEGMFFTDAYASCPVCSPTRASVLTGRYPARLGLTQFLYGESRGKLEFIPFLDHLPTSEPSVATALKNADYQTWHVGKWHLGKNIMPADHGFDVNVGGCGWGLPQNGYFSPWDIPGMENGKDGDYLTDHLTDRTLDLIRERDKERPFFLHLSHYAVHTPIQAKEKDIQKYREKARREGLDRMDVFEEGEEFPVEHKRGKHVQRRLLQSDPVYAAMVENMDWNIGRVLDALEEEGIAENTLVIFTSDNGGLSTAEGSPTCNRPLSEGKGWMYDGGTREPLLARWPGVIAAGTRCETPVTSTDFFPTFLEAANLPLQPRDHCDGVSLMPLLTQQGALQRDAIYWHYPHYSNQGGTPGCSIRAGDWKLIEFFEDGALELYNLREDVAEDHNRIHNEPEKARELHEKLKAWREEVEATIPGPNPDWGA